MPICSRSTLADLTPKYPTLVARTPGWQLYSVVLGVKFSGQYPLNIAIDYSLLGAHLFRLFSQILYQAPNQLIYTRKASADTRRRGGGLAFTLAAAFAASYTTPEQDRQTIREAQDYKPTGH